MSCWAARAVTASGPTPASSSSAGAAVPTRPCSCRRNSTPTWRVSPSAKAMTPSRWTCWPWTNTATGTSVTSRACCRTTSCAWAMTKAMRDAIGPDVDIIVEMHSFTSAAPAIQFGRMIEELGVLYYEEPVMPLNPKMMKQVADHVNIPLASGERIYWRWGYRPFLEDGSLSVIQPDICTCGGISEVKKICDMAHVYDVTVQIHVCGGPISTAAALHMEAAIPNFMIHELHRYALLEPNTRTCIHNYMPSKGRYTVPELPGLGQELTPETIAASDIITVK
ncbi:mandelate racemase/muconate lactonizing enzyme family protein [Desulfovibrio piger]